VLPLSEKEIKEYSSNGYKAMSVELNHIIIWAKDKRASASSLASWDLQDRNGQISSRSA
jgi:hypothetical protein